MQKATAIAIAARVDEEPPRERMQIRTPPLRLKTVPREVKWLVYASLMMVLLGLAWLFVPRKPEKSLMLLGSIDRIPPSAAPTSKPSSKPRPSATPTPRPPGATVLGTPLPAPPRR
jgi:hypothetical protein